MLGGALIVASSHCGYPSFTFGVGTGGGDAGDGASSSSSSASGGPTCADVDGTYGCCTVGGDVLFCNDGKTVMVQTCDNPLIGTCGWDSVNMYYACGGSGADPSNEHPMSCPQ